MQSIKGQTVLVLGATSPVGMSAAQQFLNEGCRVVLVAETENGLRALVNRFEPFKAQMIGIIGNYSSRHQIEEIRTVMKAALNGDSIDHVISAIGLDSPAREGISTGDLNALRTAMEETVYPTILCAQVLLQDLKDKHGSTYTIVSGRRAHTCDSPVAWVATVKNSALNGVVESLNCDLAAAEVRINGMCVQYHTKATEGTAAITPTHVEGVNFLEIVQTKNLRGSLVCPDDIKQGRSAETGTRFAVQAS